jgi:aspartyl-tRNA synthetase
MKLIDMKLPKKTKKELEAIPSVKMDERDRWPYGLQLRFEKEQISKMPELERLKVGNVVNISGIGKVVGVRMSERQKGENDHTIEVQIEKIGVSSVKKPEDMDMPEYNQARKEGRI